MGYCDPGKDEALGLGSPCMSGSTDNLCGVIGFNDRKRLGIASRVLRTTVITSAGPGEDEIELLVAFATGRLVGVCWWWRTAEEWDASSSRHK